MKRDIVINASWTISEAEISWRGIRAGGPGGQNVNKVSSKVELRWNLHESRSVPERFRARIVERMSNRITTAGDIIIVAGRFRDQPRNLEDAIERLAAALRDAIKVIPVRRKTKVSRGAKERRLESKGKHSQKKASRRTTGHD